MNAPSLLLPRETERHRGACIDCYQLELGK